MTTEVLTQLRALRESIAETLRKDPRYLTLAALDKSIVEISGVLSAAGIDVGPAPASAPMHFETSKTTAAASAAPATPATPSPFSAGAAAVSGPAPIRALAAAAPVAKPHAMVPAAASDPAPAPMAAAPALETAESEAAESETDEAHVDEHGTDESEPAEPEPGDGPADEESAGEAHAHHDAPDTDEVEDEADEETAGKDETTDRSADDVASPDAHASVGEKGDEAEKDADARGEDKPDAAVIPKGKASGYTPMAAKPGVTQYQPAMSVKFGKLPNKVDLRPLMTPIEDQGETSSCVANAVAGAYEYWIKKASKQDHNISRLFVYYNARWRDGSQDKDDGSVIQLAMEGLAKFGACNEKVWPFDTHLVLKKPGAEAYEDAAPYKVHDMAQVPLKLESWKQALAEGKPIVFGCELFDSFDECSTRGGVVPMPAPDDIARKKHSGHSMCAVGYSDSEKVFIVRNSWGPALGRQGLLLHALRLSHEREVQRRRLLGVHSEGAVAAAA